MRLLSRQNKLEDQSVSTNTGMHLTSTPETGARLSTRMGSRSPAGWQNSHIRWKTRGSATASSEERSLHTEHTGEHFTLYEDSLILTTYLAEKHSRPTDKIATELAETTGGHTAEQISERIMECLEGLSNWDKEFIIEQAEVD